MRLTIYETLQFIGLENIDVGDDYFDFVCNIGCSMKKSQDPYYKLMRFFCTHIELSNYKANWYSNAFISEFIKKNIDAFTTFMNEENNENFQPQKYDDIDDETWYDLYMNTFKNLVDGNYSEDQYEKLLHLLGGK